MGTNIFEVSDRLYNDTFLRNTYLRSTNKPSKFIGKMEPLNRYIAYQLKLGRILKIILTLLIISMQFQVAISKPTSSLSKIILGKTESQETQNNTVVLKEDSFNSMKNEAKHHNINENDKLISNNSKRKTHSSLQNERHKRSSNNPFSMLPIKINKEDKPEKDGNLLNNIKNDISSLFTSSKDKKTNKTEMKISHKNDTTSTTKVVETQLNKTVKENTQSTTKSVNSTSENNLNMSMNMKTENSNKSFSFPNNNTSDSLNLNLSLNDTKTNFNSQLGISSQNWTQPTLKSGKTKLVPEVSNNGTTNSQANEYASRKNQNETFEKSSLNKTHLELPMTNNSQQNVDITQSKNKTNNNDRTNFSAEHDGNETSTPHLKLNESNVEGFINNGNYSEESITNSNNQNQTFRLDNTSSAVDRSLHLKNFGEFQKNNNNSLKGNGSSNGISDIAHNLLKNALEENKTISQQNKLDKSEKEPIKTKNFTGAPMKNTSLDLNSSFHSPTNIGLHNNSNTSGDIPPLSTKLGNGSVEKNKSNTSLSPKSFALGDTQIPPVKYPRNSTTYPHDTPTSEGKPSSIPSASVISSEPKLSNGLPSTGTASSKTKNSTTTLKTNGDDAKLALNTQLSSSPLVHTKPQIDHIIDPPITEVAGKLPSTTGGLNESIQDRTLTNPMPKIASSVGTNNNIELLQTLNNKPKDIPSNPQINTTNPLITPHDKADDEVLPSRAAGSLKSVQDETHDTPTSEGKLSSIPSASVISSEPKLSNGLPSTGTASSKTKNSTTTLKTNGDDAKLALNTQLSSSPLVHTKPQIDHIIDPPITEIAGNLPSTTGGLNDSIQDRTLTNPMPKIASSVGTNNNIELLQTLNNKPKDIPSNPQINTTNPLITPHDKADDEVLPSRAAGSLKSVQDESAPVNRANSEIIGLHPSSSSVTSKNIPKVELVDGRTHDLNNKTISFPSKNTTIKTDSFGSLRNSSSTQGTTVNEKGGTVDVITQENKNNSPNYKSNGNFSSSTSTYTATRNNQSTPVTENYSNVVNNSSIQASMGNLNNIQRPIVYKKPGAVYAGTDENKTNRVIDQNATHKSEKGNKNDNSFSANITGTGSLSEGYTGKQNAQKPANILFLNQTNTLPKAENQIVNGFDPLKGLLGKNGGSDSGKGSSNKEGDLSNIPYTNDVSEEDDEIPYTNKVNSEDKMKGSDDEIVVVSESTVSSSRKDFANKVETTEKTRGVFPVDGTSRRSFNTTASPLPKDGKSTPTSAIIEKPPFPINPKKTTTNPKGFDEKPFLINPERNKPKPEVIDEHPFLINPNDRRPIKPSTTATATLNNQIIETTPDLQRKTVQTTTTEDIESATPTPMASNSTDGEDKKDCENGNTLGGILGTALHYGALGGAAGAVGAMLPQILNMIKDLFKKDGGDDGNKKDDDTKTDGEGNQSEKQDTAEAQPENTQDILEKEISDAEDKVIDEIDDKIDNIKGSVVDTIKGKLTEVEDGVFEDLKQQILNGDGTMLQNVKAVVGGENNVFKNVKGRLLDVKDSLVSDVKTSLKSAIENDDDLSKLSKLIHKDSVEMTKVGGNCGNDNYRTNVQMLFINEKARTRRTSWPPTRNDFLGKVGSVESVDKKLERAEQETGSPVSNEYSGGAPREENKTVVDNTSRNVPEVVTKTANVFGAFKKFMKN